MMSQTKETCTNTNSKRCSQIKEIKMINIVKDFGVCFVIVERDVEEIDSFFFERDKCFVFQTLVFLLQCHLLFIELESLGKQANKELLCFQFEFEKRLQRGLERKHAENVSSIFPEHSLSPNQS